MRIIATFRQEHNIAQKVANLQHRIKKLGMELKKKLLYIKQQNKTIAIYGVPAKATSLMYVFDLDPTIIDFAVDDAPLKQGTFTPGKHIPVFSPDEIYKRQPDYLLVLAWNFSASIIEKHKDYKGIWIMPLPEYKEVVS
jgi:hypothetical protein